jgi:hypothetical protein
MRHEPSDSCLPLQPTGGQRCPSCRAVKPAEDFPDRAKTSASCCATCRQRRAVVAYRHRQRTLRRFVRRAEAGYCALLAEHRGDGTSAA